jgi:GNAT superfamily N-acetyltransferase
MFHVKTMSQKDFPFAVAITRQMKWGLSQGDFEFASELEPDGCFVLFDDSERIGLATTISYGKIAWFGNLIVNENKRNRGAGSTLVTHALEYLKSRNAETVGLYAYLERIPFYERLGFKSDSEFLVLKGKGFTSKSTLEAKQVASEDLREIEEFDQSCFGASRMKMLEPIILDPDNLCYVMREKNEISGYCVAKKYGDKAELGPLVCRQKGEKVALELLKKILDRLAGVEVALLTPAKESMINSALRKEGFLENLKVQRMFFGPSVGDRCLCVAESLERG